MVFEFKCSVQIIKTSPVGVHGPKHSLDDDVKHGNAKCRASPCLHVFLNKVDGILRGGQAAHRVDSGVEEGCIAVLSCTDTCIIKSKHRISTGGMPRPAAWHVKILAYFISEADSLLQDMPWKALRRLG